LDRLGRQVLGKEHEEQLLSEEESQDERGI